MNELSTEHHPTERQFERDGQTIAQLRSLLLRASAYVEVEARLENSGMGRVVGNPAKKLLREIDEALGNGGTK